jgi:phosphatidylglycerol lysyltransferase
VNILSIKEKTLKIFKVLFPVLLFLLALFEIKKFIMGLDMQLLEQEIGQIRVINFILILAVLACALIPMLLYDAMIMKINGIKVPTKKLLEQATIVNSFSNLIGMGGLIGVGLRINFYQNDGAEKGKLLKTIAVVSLFYLSGISLLAWVLLIGFHPVPLLKQTKWLYFVVIGIALYTPILIGILRKRKANTRQTITLQQKLVLIGISLLDWLVVFLAVWFLAFVLKIPIPFSSLLPIFIIASCAGILSLIPGGLGSFDLVFLWGTGSLGILDEQVVVLLLLYRIGYFFIPFIIGVLLFMKDYWQKWNNAWDQVPDILVQRISHWLLSVLVFLSGIVLLLSAALPDIIGRTKLLENIISLPVISLSHQLSVATGFLLLGLSRGIQYKVKRAYHLTIIVLSIAAILSLSKGIDYEEATFLLGVVVLLHMAKGRFYREGYVLTWGKTACDISIIFVITSMYLMIGYFNLPESKVSIPAKFLPYLITDYKDLFFSAVIGLLIAFLLLIIGYFIGKSNKWLMGTSHHQEKEIMQHIQQYKGNVLTHLIFLHDKYVYWNKEHNVLLAYQKYADKLIVLGDLVGERAAFPAVLEEFLTDADLYGYTPVFYQVSKNTLPLLHENGFDFFKLGEESFVDLEQFSLTGKKMKGMRAIKNKFDREQFTFEMAEPPYSQALLDELNVISDAWLKGRKEKGFSLGFFDRDYLNKSGMAMLKDPAGKVVGFASLMPSYDNHQTISVDLMRFRPDAPAGTMDFIFLCLIAWAKEKGFKQFNLGMAPLSNVGLSKFSFFSEKIAAQIYLHGQFVYHFQGLRNFKEKYGVSWVPKYLAYRRKTSLSITMAQVALLIGRRKK